VTSPPAERTSRSALPLRPRAALAALTIGAVAALAANGLNALGRRHGLSALATEGSTAAAASPAPGTVLAPPPRTSSASTVPATSSPAVSAPSTAPAAVGPAPAAAAAPIAAPTANGTNEPAGKRPVKRAPEPASEGAVLATLEVTTDPPVRIGRSGRRGTARVQLRTSSGQINVGGGLDPESDPFRLRVTYRLDDDRAVFTVVADPWAIAQNGIGAGLGRTPVTIDAGAERVVMMLTSPIDKRKLRLSLELR